MAVVLCEDAATRAAYSDHADATEELADLAAAIRALPLPEEAPLTPREKLRRVREAREVLATVRVATVGPGYEFALDEGTGHLVGGWRRYVAAWARPKDEPTRWAPGCELSDARTWVLDTLRAEGWDVVEEGEGDG